MAAMIPGTWASPGAMAFGYIPASFILFRDEQSPGGNMIIRVKVHPGSGMESVTDGGGILQVRVREPAERNRANIATIRLLSKHFGKPVRIVAGLKSRTKVVEV